MKPKEVVGRIAASLKSMKWVPDHVHVEASSRFTEDLGFDDLDRVELVMMVEEDLGIQIPEEELEGVDTVGKLASCFIRRMDLERKGGAR